MDQRLQFYTQTSKFFVIDFKTSLLFTKFQIPRVFTRNKQ